MKKKKQYLSDSNKFLCYAKNLTLNVAQTKWLRDGKNKIKITIRCSQFAETDHYQKETKYLSRFKGLLFLHRFLAQIFVKKDF